MPRPHPVAPLVPGQGIAAPLGPFARAWHNQQPLHPKRQPHAIRHQVARTSNCCGVNPTASASKSPRTGRNALGQNGVKTSWVDCDGCGPLDVRKNNLCDVLIGGWLEGDGRHLTPVLQRVLVAAPADLRGRNRHGLPLIRGGD